MPARPRLLFVHEDTRRRGGGEAVLAHLAGLAGRAARVDLAVLFRAPADLAPDLRGLFHRAQTFDFPLDLRAPAVPSFLRNLCALRRLLLVERAAGCVALGYPAAFRAALAAAGTHTPLLWACIFPAGPRWASGRAKRSAGLRLLGLSGAVAVCPNPAMRDELAALGYPARLLRVVRIGIDLDSYRPPSTGRHEHKQAFRSRHGVPAADLVAACVARIDPVKRHETLIRAVAHAASQGRRIVLLCLGGHDARHQGHLDELRRLARDLGVGDLVLWPGHSDEIREWLAASDVAVLASRREAAGMALIEAAAAGLPLVASDVGGIPDVVVPGRTGNLFPVDDAAEAARILDRLAGDEREREALGAGARRLAEERFGRARCDAEWARLLASLIDSDRAEVAS